MTKPDLSTLTSLLERVREAEGADRELDARIMAAVAAPPGAFAAVSRFNGEWCIYLPETELRPVNRTWEHRGGWHRREGWPITASLDAALALVERVLPGWPAELFQRIDTAEWGAHFRRPETDTEYAKTPALALLAALLTALLQQAEADEPQGARGER